jgi:hypothetical protein
MVSGGGGDGTDCQKIQYNSLGEKMVLYFALFTLLKTIVKIYVLYTLDGCILLHADT